MNFNAKPKINAFRHVGKYFPKKLPSEGRLERDAPIGVFVGQNEGHWKILPKKVADGRVFFWRLWVVRIDHTAKP